MIGIDLRGHVVAVTGSSGGIGSAIARGFAEAGASVLLHRRSGEAPAIDGDHFAVTLDLTDHDGPERLVSAAVDHFGRLDCVVNNAAVQTLAGLVDMTDVEWTTMIDTNVTACHRIVAAFARHVSERVDTVDDEAGGGVGPSVVNIASIEGLNPAEAHGHYAVSKAALLMHTRASALELGPLGIRVNAVSPGLIDRDGLADDWPDGVNRYESAAPLGRLGTATDVANACVMLASPLAGWITGANLVVDGGVTARPTW